MSPQLKDKVEGDQDKESIFVAIDVVLKSEYSMNQYGTGDTGGDENYSKLWKVVQGPIGTHISLVNK